MGQLENRFYPRVFALVAGFLLAYALFLILKPFFAPFLWALLLAVLSFPLNRRLRQKLGGRRGLAALLLMLAAILVVVVPALLVVVVFARQATDLVAKVQTTAIQYNIARPSDILQIPMLDRAIRWVETRVPVSADQIHGWLLDAAKRLLQTLIAASGSVFAGALSALISTALMLFLLFFLLRDGEEMVQRVLLAIPMDEQRKLHLLQHLSAVTQAVVFGALLTAVVQGTLVGIAFALVGLASPVVFGVLAMLTSLIPLVGTTLVWVPAAVILVTRGHYGAAIFLIVWGIAIVTSADNFLRPMFISGRAHISTLPVFLGLVGGVSAFGPIGMVVGPVIVALGLALLRFAEEARRVSSSP